MEKLFKNKFREQPEQATMENGTFRIAKWEERYAPTKQSEERALDGTKKMVKQKENERLKQS